MSTKLDRKIAGLIVKTRAILAGLENLSPGAEDAEHTMAKLKARKGPGKASAKPAPAVAPKTGKSGPQMAAATLRKQVLSVLGQSKKVNLSASQVCERIAGSDQRKVAAALKALCASGDAKMEGARSGAKYRRLYPLG